MRLLIGLSLILSVAFSCKRHGCNDPNAKNYNVSANKNNGSCLYEGQIIFWLDSTTAHSADSANIETLFVYHNGNLMDQMSISNHSEDAPASDDTSGINFMLDMGYYDSGDFLFHVYDEDTIERWSSIHPVIAGSCVKVELEW